MTTETKQSWVSRDIYSDMRQQRDELAEALLDARVSLVKAGHHEGISGALIRIDAALAKVQS